MKKKEKLKFIKLKIINKKNYLTNEVKCNQIIQILHWLFVKYKDDN